ncbi:MAG TPA: divergent polysaccharide deacetylase family protein [Methylovirgula sp.]
MASGDDLNDPLGLDRPPPRGGLPLRLPLLACALLAIGGGILFLNWRGDPFGGEPHAVAVINPAAPAQSTAPTFQQKQADGAPNDVTGSIPNAANDGSAADYEHKSGVKVVRSGGGDAPGAMIIEVPKVLANRLAPAPDPRLIEKSRYGLLPRIGKDGARPADVYARPLPATVKTNAPRIALVIGGVGLSDAATAQAIETLPGEVTLAFAPYGNDLKGKSAQARDAGHEVILQLPMEPIDYPQTNPGPHTLLVSANAGDNVDSLHWLLARFTGYAGVANFLGAKFAMNSDALKPVLGDINARGLFFFDDGSTAQSIGLSVAQDLGLPAIRADILLDAPGDGMPQGIATSTAIDLNLAKLEAIARDKGVAVGMANDLPASVDRLALYAKEAESRGIVLIPLSAAVRANGNGASAQSTQPGQ